MQFGLIRSRILGLFLFLRGQGAAVDLSRIVETFSGVVLIGDLVTDAFIMAVVLVVVVVFERL